MKDLKLTLGDIPTLQYQLKNDGTALNITGYTFTFGARVTSTSTTYAVGPVAGVIADATAGKFNVTLKSTAGNSLLTTTFDGVFELAMTNSSSERTTLTPAGGKGISVKVQITT